MIKSLSQHEANVYGILAEGGKHSVADIVIRTHFSDPRTTIAQMRQKGINIRDEWRKSKNGRYKLYFL